MGGLDRQRDVVAGGAIDLDELAEPEILDPRRGDGEHSRVAISNNRLINLDESGVTFRYKITAATAGPGFAQ